MPELSKEELLAAACPSLWIRQNKIKLPEGPFTFKDHEYLREPLDSQAQVEVEQKATQGGFSVKETLVDLHGCAYGFYPAGVGYVMPTETDVQKFAKTKFDPIIRNNYHAIGKYVKTGAKGTDNAYLKSVGQSHIHFVTATLSRTINGEKESANLRSFSCDKFVCDEYDMMDLSVAEKLRGRFGHSRIKQERFISNPTGENYGINALFQDSDQRYWHRLCPACGKYTCPELEFLRKPDGIIKQDKDGKGYIACVHCGVQLPLYYADVKNRRDSRWIATCPGRPIVGRLWSQLNSAYHDPYTILAAFYNPPEGNLKDVMRYRLGFAYTAKEDQLRPFDLYECCTNEPFKMSHAGPCIMGVDVGIVKHIVIGIRTGKDRYELIYIGTRKEWSEIHDLAKKYNVRLAGIDVAPDLDSARGFQKSENYPVWLCDYKTSKSVATADFDEKSKIVKANRTEAFDSTHRLFTSKQMSLPRRELLEDFVKQVCNPFKQEIKNEKTGVTEYRYIGKNDHYRNALNYFYLVGRRAPRIESRGFSRQTVCNNN